VWVRRTIAAGGVTQWIECAGSGRVTVVVIPGLHATHTMWSKVLPSFARTTRTCIVDRAGLGGSPPRHPHRTVDAGLHAAELWAVLTKAGVRGPFVVVGHSYGGLIARAFVARHRTSVVGLMLVEGVAPYDRLSHYWAEGGDRVDTWASSKAALPVRLGSMPLVVEAAQDPDRSYWGGPAYGGSVSDITDWKAHQRSASRLSTDSTFVIVRHSAHVIEHDQPAAVIAGLRLLVSAAVAHRWMPRCALSAYGSQPLCG
jgi:pimeloyl-ACP methyl ester carboxylesterase